MITLRTISYYDYLAQLAIISAWWTIPLPYSATLTSPFAMIMFHRNGALPNG